MGKLLKEYWGNSPKWTRIMFWIFLGISTILIIASWFVPPMGEINSSVLSGVGEIMGFASLGVAFECVFAGMEVTLKKGDASINISHDVKCECKSK